MIYALLALLAVVFFYSSSDRYNTEILSYVVVPDSLQLPVAMDVALAETLYYNLAGSNFNGQAVVETMRNKSVLDVNAITFYFGFRVDPNDGKKKSLREFIRQYCNGDELYLLRLYTKGSILKL